MRPGRLARSVRHERQALGLLVRGPNCGARRALSPTRRSLLKAVVTGLCALVLCATPVAAHASSSADLGRQLSRHMKTMKKDTSVIQLLRESPLASLRPTLREGGEPSSRSGAQAPREHEGEGRPRARRARTADSSGEAEAAAGAARAIAREGDLPRLRLLLQTGAPGRPLRVRVPDERRERSVPRPLPDGLERAPALRPRRVRAPAGAGRVPVLRPLGPRLEPVVVQALELRHSAISCANCGTRRLRRVPTALDRW